MIRPGNADIAGLGALAALALTVGATVMALGTAVFLAAASLAGPHS